MQNKTTNPRFMSSKTIKIVILLFVLNVLVLAVYLVNENRKKRFNIPDNLVNVNIEGADSLSIYNNSPKVVFYLDFDCSKCFNSLFNIDSLYSKLLENGIDMFIVAGSIKLENVRVLLDYNNLNHLKVYYDEKRELPLLNRMHSILSLFTLLAEDNIVLYQGKSFTGTIKSDQEFKRALKVLRELD